jgi:hypothetical protein
MAQSASHEQMDDALANGAQELAVAGDDSAFTIWKSNAAGFPVYVSRYTPDGAWSEPALLDADSGDRNGVVIAAEHDGDAIAAWLRVTAAGSEIRAARYHAGWQPSQVISALTDSVDPVLQIVSNPNGDYFVAWAQASAVGGTTRKQIAHYLHDQGWQPLFAPSCALEADPSTAVPFGPLTASINPRGDALFSWFDSGLLLGSYLFAERYLADGGFQPCEAAVPQRNGQSLTHAQALDDAGRGFLAWNQGSDYNDAPNGEIDASTFDGAWSAPVTVSGYGEGPVLAASDAAGHLIVAWPERRFIGTVMVSTSQLGGPWSNGLFDAEIGPFSARTGLASAPVLSMSRSGTALLAWQVTPLGGAQTTSMFATSWRFESGFAKQTLISTGQVRDYVSVVSDPEGNGMLLWRSGRAAGMPLLQAARYRPSVGWQTPALDVASEAGDLPILAAGESGELVAVWYGAYPYAAGATVFR